jgi:hypothetical protein
MSALVVLVGLCRTSAISQLRVINSGPVCDSGGVSDAGKPLFFPQHDGIAFGVSLPKRSFLVGEQIPAYVWINNVSDKDYASSTCGMWTDWDVAVWNQSGERLPSYMERQHLSPGDCSANALIRVKAHYCMLANELALEKNFELKPDKYRLGELPWPPFMPSPKLAPAKMPAVDDSLLFNVGDRSSSEDTISVPVKKSAVDEAVTAPKVLGRVVRSDNGTPIPAAEVFLNTGAPNDSCCHKAVTDSNGDFSFLNLPDGAYTANAFADGFVTGDYHCTPGPKSVCKDRVQHIDSSSHTKIDFRLLPEAVVTGQIVTSDGHPVGAGLLVTAVPVSLLGEGSNGVYSTWSEGTTDANGNFRLGKLPPSSYLIRVRQEMGGRLPVPASDPRYHEAWFGNSPTPRGAVPITLKEAETRNDVRIVVHTEARYNIVLWLSGPDGVPPPREYIVSIPESSTTALKQPDGSYLIRNVSPGHYKLNIFAAGLPGNLAWPHYADVDVGNEDTSMHVNITVKPSKPSDGGPQ